MISFFSLLWGLPAPPRAAAGAESSSGRKRKKEVYPPAGTSLQVQIDRYNSPCKEIPAGKYLQARCAESRLSALGLCRWNTPSLGKEGIAARTVCCIH
jgi:hypothetical protein